MQLIFFADILLYDYQANDFALCIIKNGMIVDKKLCRSQLQYYQRDHYKQRLANA